MSPRGRPRLGLLAGLLALAVLAGWWLAGSGTPTSPGPAGEEDRSSGAPGVPVDGASGAPDETAADGHPEDDSPGSDGVAEGTAPEPAPAPERGPASSGGPDGDDGRESVVHGQLMLPGIEADADEFLVSVEGRPRPRVRPEEDGRFRLDGLPDGSHVVQARGPEALGGSTRVEVREGQGRAFIMVRREGAILEGIVQRGGRPASGARVLASTPGRTSRTRTGEDGRFHLDGLRGGRYQVVARRGSEVALARDVRLEPGRRTTVRLDLAEGARIAGRVRRADDGEAAGLLVAFPVRTPALPGRLEMREVISEENGSFSLVGLLPGTTVQGPRVATGGMDSLVVEAVRDGEGRPVDPVDGSLRAPDENVELVVSRGARVRCIVTGPDGPLPGAPPVVRAEPLDGVSSPTHRLEDRAADSPEHPEGHAGEIGPLRPGSYRFVAFAPGHARATSGVVRLERGVEETVVIRLGRAVPVTGLVVGPHGNPLRDARVTLVARWNRDEPEVLVPRGQTGSDGRFEVAVRPGTHRLRVDHPDHALALRTGLEVAGPSDVGTVELIRGGTIRVAVRTGDGDPVRNAGVRVLRPDGIPVFRPRSGIHQLPAFVTEVDGTVDVGSLAPGRYVVEVRRNRGAERPDGRATLEVRAGETTGATIDLE